MVEALIGLFVKIDRVKLLLQNPIFGLYDLEVLFYVLGLFNIVFVLGLHFGELLLCYVLGDGERVVLLEL